MLNLLPSLRKLNLGVMEVSQLNESHQQVIRPDSADPDGRFLSRAELVSWCDCGKGCGSHFPSGHTLSPKEKRVFPCKHD